MGLLGHRILTIVGKSRVIYKFVLFSIYVWICTAFTEKNKVEKHACVHVPRNLCMASIREQRTREWSTRFFTRGKIDGFENGFSEPFTKISKVLLDVLLTHTNMGYVCLTSM